MLLQKKVAIVTGGATGLGRAIASALAHEGASVIIDFVGKPDKAEATVKAIHDAGGKAAAVEADVSDSDQVVVGLEPSCVPVFRDEMVNLLGSDEDAARLSKQTMLLSEILAQKASDFRIPTLDAKAVVHRHCHQKSVLAFSDEETLLKKLGLDYTILESGCCGRPAPS